MNNYDNFCTAIYNMDLTNRNEVTQLAQNLVKLKEKEKVRHINQDKNLDNLYHDGILTSRELIEKRMDTQGKYNQKKTFIKIILQTLTGSIPNSDSDTDTDSGSGNSYTTIPETDNDE